MPASVLRWVFRALKRRPSEIQEDQLYWNLPWTVRWVVYSPFACRSSPHIQLATNEHKLSQTMLNLQVASCCGCVVIMMYFLRICNFWIWAVLVALPGTCPLCLMSSMLRSVYYCAHDFFTRQDSSMPPLHTEHSAPK